MLFFIYTNYKIVINLSGAVQYNKNDIKEDAPLFTICAGLRRWIDWF